MNVQKQERVEDSLERLMEVVTNVCYDLKKRIKNVCYKKNIKY